MHDVKILKDRDLAEILADSLKAKVKIINNLPNDIYSRNDFETSLPIIANGLVMRDVLKNKKSWILSRIIGDLHISPNDIAIQFIQDLNLTYLIGTEMEYEPLEQTELIHAIFNNPKYSERAIEITVNIYSNEYPKLKRMIDRIFAVAKTDSDDRAQKVLRLIAELYVSKDADSASGITYSVLACMQRTLQEDFLLPSLCMYDPLALVVGREKSFTSVEKVMMRFSTGSSNPYAAQKVPDEKFISTVRFRPCDPASGENSSWILKKYLKKRREALCNSLGFANEDLKNALFQTGFINNNQKIYTTMCDIFHIPAKDLKDSYEELISPQSDDMREMLTVSFIDCYYIAKLCTFLDALSDEELENITVRDITGVIGVGDIEEDASFFKQLPIIVSLFLLANHYRQDYYSLYNFSTANTAETHSLNRSYQKTLSECRAEIEEKNKVIARYQAQEKKREIRKSKASEKPLLAEISSLKNTISKKDKEIEGLKSQLEEAKEYYNLLDQCNGEALTKEIKKYDLSILKGKRIAFVCNDIDATVPTLRKEFPDSVFIETETTQSRAQNVDLIVFFIKHISHSIYFSTKKLYRNVPVFAYNRRSVDELKNELAKYFSEH